MLAFFRRVLSSWVAVALLGIIMVAFIVTGVGTPGGGLIGGTSDDNVAVVAGRPVTVAELVRRAESNVVVARQQQPDLTMQAYLAATGGVGPLVEQHLAARVLTAWGEKHGITASDRLVGGEIGSVSAFLGPTGQFEEQRMQAVLAQRRMTVADLKDAVREDAMRRQLLVPLTLGARAPTALLTPFATLLIDRRQGAIGLVEAKADGLPAPTPAEISAWYKSHIGRYSLPERRVLRYALISGETAPGATPTEAEIAAAYKADAAKYAGGETRTVSQAVLPDETAAKAFAAKLAGGTPFAEAATQAGFTPADLSLGEVTKAALARSTNAATANAAFALKQGGSSAPIKSELGWAVVHVDAVKVTPARSLAEARDEIAAALATRKGQEAVARLVEQVENAVADGASFNEVVARHKLAVVTTPALLPNGMAPGAPGFTADATVQALLKASNDVRPDDEPTVETIDPSHFALLSVASLVPAAPVPLAEIQPRVTADMMQQRAADRARKTAEAILAKVKAGQPVPAAFAAAGLPAPRLLSVSQVEIAQAGDRVPPVVRTLFRLAPGNTALVQEPGGRGWFVVKLDRIVPGDAKQLPQIIAGTRAELSQSLGLEYAEQFARAAQGEIKVRRNPAAQAKLDQQLRGTASAGQ